MSKFSKLVRDPKKFVKDSAVVRGLESALHDELRDELARLRKESVLQTYDFAMFAAASNYALNEQSERIRSCRNLERLFYYLARILEPPLSIEAGAKDAAASQRLSEQLNNTRIVAFEANPHTYDRFRKQIDFAGVGVEYVNLALSDKVGEVEFNVRQTEDGTPSADGQGSLGSRRVAAPASETVTVRSTTIDEFFSDQDRNDCVLWVDVEGAQEQVLRGATATLEKAAVVFIELEDKRIWDRQWLRPKVASYLYDHGLVPVARDFQSRYQYNVLFLRQKMLEFPRCRWALTMFHSNSGEDCRERAGVPFK